MIDKGVYFEIKRLEDEEEIVDIILSTIANFYDGRGYLLYATTSILAEEKKSYIDIKKEEYKKTKGTKNAKLSKDDINKRIQADKELLKLGIKKIGG